VEIVTIPKGRLVRSFDAGPVVSMALSPSGRYLVTGTLHATVQIWNVITGACLVAYGADSVITAVALGRDRASIVIGDDVGRLQMLRLNRMRLR
jgi:WD40 repeat protein